MTIKAIAFDDFLFLLNCGKVRQWHLMLVSFELQL